MMLVFSIQHAQYHKEHSLKISSQSDKNFLRYVRRRFCKFSPKNGCGRQPRSGTDFFSSKFSLFNLFLSYKSKINLKKSKTKKNVEMGGVPP